MNLALLSPLFGWLLPLAAVPVIFHLLFRLKKRPLAFPSLMFFLRVDPKLHERRKLREILLLILRVLFLIFLVLFLARPLWRGAGGGGPVAAVLVIDNSGSMSAPGEGGRSKLALAVEAAATLAPRIERCGLTLTVEDHRVPVPDALQSEPAKLRAVLDQIGDTEASGTPAAALGRALSLLAASPLARREIHVFTDLQAGEWDAATGEGLMSVPGVTIAVHRIAGAGGEVRNVAIQSVLPRGNRLLAGRPVPAMATLANTGAAELAVRVNAADDGGHETTQSVTVPAHGARQVPLIFAAATPGFHWARVWIEGDGFAADNRAGFGCWCHERSSVVFVGERARFGLLPLAIAPDGDGKLSGLVPSFPQAGQLDAALAAKPALAVATWDNLATDQGLAERLRAYVSAGGALLVVPKPDGLNTAGTPDWLGAHCEGETKSPNGSQLIALDPRSPLWNDVRDEAGAVALGQVSAVRHAVLRLGEKSRGLLGLEDGRALLAETALGSGRVFACGLAFTPAWSSLPLKGWSLAMIQAMALGTATDAAPVAAIVAGNRLPPAPGDKRPCRIRSLAGDPMDWKGARDQTPVFPCSGVYAVEFGGGDAAGNYIAVRSSPAEGGDKFLSDGPVAALAGYDHRVADYSGPTALIADWQRARSGVDLTLPLLILAILALCGEAWVGSGGQHGHQQKPLTRPSPLPAAASLGMVIWTPQAAPLSSLALAVLLVALVVVAFNRLRQRFSPRKTWDILWPKAAIALLLLLGVFNPGCRSEHQQVSAGKLLALIDTSSSMDVVDDGRKPRLLRAFAILDQLRSAAPSGLTVEAREFDTAIRGEVKPSTPRQTERPGDVGACLVELANRPDLSTYRGVVVISDGGDEPLPASLKFPVPLALVGVGSDERTWNDLALADVGFPATAEKDVAIDLVADDTAQAQPGSALGKTLAKVGLTCAAEVNGAWQTIESRNLDLSNGRARSTFRVTPTAPGRQRYRLTVDNREGEVSTLNNSRTVSIDVRARNLHVLYFTRALGLDFKLLRGELARDPGVTFTALYRTTGERYTIQGDRIAGDGSLGGGFPAKLAELQRYDCVIVGSFPASDWPVAQQQVLVDYVSQGGAAIFLGGEDSFGAGGYAGAPVAPLLPWTVASDAGRKGSSFVQGNFPLGIPLTAASQPIVSGLAAIVTGGGAAVSSLNQCGPLRPGAINLVEVDQGGARAPLVTLQSYAKGRVLGIATNTLWKLARAGGEIGSAYGRFWRQAVRGLSGREESGRLVKIAWDRDHYRPGDEAVASISLPGGGEATRLVATVARVNASAAESAEQPVTVASESGPGSWLARLRFAERGDYHFRLVAYRGDQVADTYEKIIEVQPLLAEGARLAVDHDGLAALAAANAGAYAKETDLSPVTELINRRAAPPLVVSEWSLVHSGPWYFLAVLGLLIGEWMLRRRVNLP